MFFWYCSYWIKHLDPSCPHCRLDRKPQLLLRPDQACLCRHLRSEPVDGSPACSLSLQYIENCLLQVITRNNFTGILYLLNIFPYPFYIITYLDDKNMKSTKPGSSFLTLWRTQGEGDSIINVFGWYLFTGDQIWAELGPNPACSSLMKETNIGQTSNPWTVTG